jgi:hypothetical protein
MDDKASMLAEREKAKKHKTFNEIEKRKVGIFSITYPPPLTLFSSFSETWASAAARKVPLPRNLKPFSRATSNPSPAQPQTLLPRNLKPFSRATSNPSPAQAQTPASPSSVTLLMQAQWRMKSACSGKWAATEVRRSPFI